MKKYLKSTLFSLVALSALVLLAACGGGSTTTSSGATPTTAATATTPATPTTGATSTPATTQSGNTQKVAITTGSSGSFAFSPATLTIKTGTTVTWTNNTSVVHTVTSDDGKSFDSGTANPIAAGATFSFTFKTAGTFPYHCEIHPFMKATIIVQNG